MARPLTYSVHVGPEIPVGLFPGTRNKPPGGASYQVTSAPEILAAGPSCFPAAIKKYFFKCRRISIPTFSPEPSLGRSQYFRDPRIPPRGTKGAAPPSMAFEEPSLDLGPPKIDDRFDFLKF